MKEFIQPLQKFLRRDNMPHPLIPEGFVFDSMLRDGDLVLTRLQQVPSGMLVSGGDIPKGHVVIIKKILSPI